MSNSHNRSANIMLGVDGSGKLTTAFLVELAHGRYKGAPESWVKMMAEELLALRAIKD